MTTGAFLYPEIKRSTQCSCDPCGHNRMFAQKRKTLAKHLVGVMYSLNM